MTTIADVCLEAGVSKATVSRVLNNNSQVTEETRNKVFDAIKKLDYRPNTLARALATNKTNTIGLIVPSFEGAHYGALLPQAATSCNVAEKQLFITDGHNDPEREKEAILMLKDRRCDAIILYSRFMPEETIKTLVKSINIPLVTLNREFSDPSLPCITFDQVGAGYMITKYLLAKGHSHIACISGMNTLTGQLRLEGYKKALQEYGIPYDPRLVEPGNFHFFGGYGACLTIMKRNIAFTAIMASSDEMAVGAEKALVEAGMSIPQQVSIASIDNSRMASYAHIPLTTVYIPLKEMMNCAVNLVLEMLDHPNKLCDYQTRFVGEIVERSSSIDLIEPSHP
jgi:LacI family transcriptional regulator